uniref:Small ribosomal subunit protein uS8c n=1 Tax=Lobochlamys segnis TaxID=52035 RepID=A0A0S2IBB1_9CHLO|nr:ribosomal protein S8 [Lobochlamys segnis]
MAENNTRGLINDSISDMLTRIRNACLAKKSTVSIPFTRVNQQIAHILEKEGFIQNFQISFSNETITKLEASHSFKTSLNRNFNSLQGSQISNSTESASTYTKVQGLASQGSTQGIWSEQIEKNRSSQISTNTEILIQLKYRSKTIYKGKKKESCITNLKRISKPGLRIYGTHREIPRILGGTGIVILSTPEGIVTDREARFREIGGELLCAVW